MKTDRLSELQRLDQFETMMCPRINQLFYLHLSKNGFFTAPASTKYHGAHEGGLLDHSIEVTKALVNLTNSLQLKWSDPRSPYIVGMFHDLCKVDAYVKDGELFTYNNETLIPGHGEKSVQLLSQFMQLTEEEVLCIRWHMGAYDEKSNWDMLGRAIERYPNVLYTHTADMIAARIVGV